MLDAAAAEILAVGYTSASLSSIAARLGVTKGALAYHFPSKSDMADALFAHALGMHGRLQVSTAEAGLRGVRALVANGATAGLYTQTDIRFAAATSMLLTPGTGGLALPPLLSDLADLYAGYLRQAVEDGEVPAELDVLDAGEFMLTGGLGQLIFLTRHPERQGSRDMRFTRWQLRAIGVVDADRLVDDVLAAATVVPARFDEPGFTAEDAAR
jgi:AcrR family transcriptional regulator